MDSLKFVSTLPVTCSLTSYTSTSTSEKASSVILLPKFQNSKITSITKTDISVLTSEISTYKNQTHVNNESMAAMTVVPVDSLTQTEESTLLKNETGTLNTTDLSVNVELPDVDTYDSVKTISPLDEEISQNRTGPSNDESSQLQTTLCDEPLSAELDANETTSKNVETNAETSPNDKGITTDKGSLSDVEGAKLMTDNTSLSSTEETDSESNVAALFQTKDDVPTSDKGSLSDAEGAKLNVELHMTDYTSLSSNEETNSESNVAALFQTKDVVLTSDNGSLSDVEGAKLNVELHMTDYTSLSSNEETNSESNVASLFQTKDVVPTSDNESLSDAEGAKLNVELHMTDYTSLSSNEETNSESNVESLFQTKDVVPSSDNESLSDVEGAKLNVELHMTDNTSLSSNEETNSESNVTSLFQTKDVVPTSDEGALDKFPNDEDNMSSECIDASPESPDSIMSLHLFDNSEDDPFDMEVEEITDEQQQEEDTLDMEVEEIEDEDEQDQSVNSSETESCDSPKDDEERKSSPERPKEVPLEGEKTKSTSSSLLLRNILEEDTTSEYIEEAKTMGNSKANNDVASISSTFITSSSESSTQKMTSLLSCSAPVPTKTSTNTTVINAPASKLSMNPQQSKLNLAPTNAIFGKPTPVFLFPNKNFKKNQIQTRAVTEVTKPNEGNVISSKLVSIPVCYGDVRYTGQSAISSLKPVINVNFPLLPPQNDGTKTSQSNKELTPSKVGAIQIPSGNLLSSKQPKVTVIGTARAPSTASNLLKSIIKQRSHAPKIDSIGDITSFLVGKSFEKYKTVTTTATNTTDEKTMIPANSKTLQPSNLNMNLSLMLKDMISKRNETLNPKKIVMNLSNTKTALKEGNAAEAKIMSGFQYKQLRSTTPQVIQVYPGISEPSTYKNTIAKNVKMSTSTETTTSAVVYKNNIAKNVIVVPSVATPASSKVPITVRTNSSTKQQMETSIRVAEDFKMPPIRYDMSLLQRPLNTTDMHNYAKLSSEHSYNMISYGDALNKCISRFEVPITVSSTTTATTGVSNTLLTTKCTLATATTSTPSTNKQDDFMSKACPTPSYTFNVYRVPTGVSSASCTPTSFSISTNAIGLTAQPNLVIRPEATQNVVHTIYNDAVVRTGNMNMLGNMSSVFSSSNSPLPRPNTSTYNSNVKNTAKTITLPNVVEKSSTFKHKSDKNTGRIATDKTSHAANNIRAGEQKILFPSSLRSASAASTSAAISTANQQRDKQCLQNNRPVYLKIVTSKGIVSTTGLLLSFNSSAINSTCLQTSANILSSISSPQNVKTSPQVSSKMDTRTSANALFASSGMSNASVRLLAKHSGFSTSLPVSNKSPLILERSPVKRQTNEPPLVSKIVQPLSSFSQTNTFYCGSGVNVTANMVSASKSFSQTNTSYCGSGVNVTANMVSASKSFSQTNTFYCGSGVNVTANMVSASKSFSQTNTSYCGSGVNVTANMVSASKSYTNSNTDSVGKRSLILTQTENESQDRPSFIIDSVFSLNQESSINTKSQKNKDHDNFFCKRFATRMARFGVKLDENTKEDEGLRKPCFVVLDDINDLTESTCTCECRKDVVRKLTLRIMEKCIRRKKSKRKRLFTSRKRQAKEGSNEPQCRNSPNKTVTQPSFRDTADKLMCSHSSKKSITQPSSQDTAYKLVCSNSAKNTITQPSSQDTAYKLVCSNSAKNTITQPSSQDTAYKRLCRNSPDMIFTQSLLQNRAYKPPHTDFSKKTLTSPVVQNTVVASSSVKKDSSSMNQIQSVDVPAKHMPNSESQTIVDAKGNKFLLLKVDNKTILVPTLNKADQPKAYVIEGSSGPSLTKAIKQITEKHLSSFSESSSTSVLSVSKTTVANTATSSSSLSTTVQNPTIKSEPQTSGYSDDASKDVNISIKPEPTEQPLLSNDETNVGPPPRKIPRVEETHVTEHVSDRIKRLRDELKAREKALEDVRRRRLNESSSNL